MTQQFKSEAFHGMSKIYKWGKKQFRNENVGNIITFQVLLKQHKYV